MGRQMLALLGGAVFFTGWVAVATPTSAPGPAPTHEQRLATPASPPRWTRPLTGPGGDESARLVSDKAGGILAMVNFTRSIDVGTGPIEGSDDPTEWHTVLARYDARGQAQVLKVFHSTYGMRHVVDAQHNIVLLISAGGGVLDSAVHLAKLDATGKLLWLRPLPDGEIWPQALTTDRAGNIGVGGYTVGSGSGQLAFIKYGPEGVRQWTFTDRQMPRSEGRAATADSDGCFYVGGDAQGDDPVAEPYLVKLSPEGSPVWRRRLPGAVGFGHDVATHGNRVVLVGTFGGAFTYVDGPHVATDNVGTNQDAFVAAWTRDGDERWARNFGFDIGGVAMSEEDDGVVVAGGYQGGSPDLAVLGPLAGNPNGAANVYVAKFDRIEGKLRWARGYPSGLDLGVLGVDESSVAVTSDGRAAVVGLFHDTLQTGATKWTANGRSDLFLFGFDP
ncbi:hypothetical protein LZ198_08885 [Myxococcus sp. K15C18031901]|uniref:hypothetical protein n=1 Tax=Myxococcus dinghuensis TaxID=2906761 RepID=UPI0020A70E74|nr:hypothetical protein [Myxococcus dinghuensis]MCP3098991.1 hypothetical protein [Myxococcus dinghuensis]